MTHRADETRTSQAIRHNVGPMLVSYGSATAEQLARLGRSQPGEVDADGSPAGDPTRALHEIGWFRMPVPLELGGTGLGLVAACQEQRRLAYHAAIPALGASSHLSWAGVAADLWRQGDESLGWLLEEAVAGRIFAGSRREPGNDIPLLYSAASAEPVDGGYRFTGRRSRECLLPRWDYLGVCGMDLSRPKDPRVVHALVQRENAVARGYGAAGDARDAGTEPSEIVLDGAFVPSALVARVVTPGVGGADDFVVGLLTWTLLGEAAILCAMARRILDLTVAALRRERSIVLSRDSLIYHAGIQSSVADMAIALEGMEQYLDGVAGEWHQSPPTDRAGWTNTIFVARHRSAEAAHTVAALSGEIVASVGMSGDSELEQLSRAASVGTVARSDRFLTRELVAKTILGLDPDEQPRWG